MKDTTNRKLSKEKFKQRRKARANAKRDKETTLVQIREYNPIAKRNILTFRRVPKKSIMPGKSIIGSAKLVTSSKRF